MKLFKLFIALIIVLVNMPTKSFAKFPYQNSYTKITDNVSITIDSKTTEDDFKSISVMLEENGIIATFSNIKRNENGLITSIKIKLEDTLTNNRTVSNSSSNSPINTIIFGRKNGGLFVTQSNRPEPFITSPNSNSPNFQYGFDRDSLFDKQLKMFEDMFSEDANGNFMINGKAFNFDEMEESFRSMFQFMEDANGNKSLIMQGFDDDPFCDKNNKYKFNDATEFNKHIIINGRVSNYQELKKLADQDKLESVDRLKSQTAKSIYGEKGKFGAIIATTK